MKLRSLAGVTALLVAGCSSGSVVHRANGSPVGAATTQATTVARSSPSASAFHFVDVTFVGRRGWALGTITCASGRCAALSESTDGGLVWSRPRGLRVHVPDSGRGGAACLRPCVEHVRFATDTVGYLFGTGPWSADGRSVLLMTVDGGRSWRAQAAGADALETLDGNVLRVVDPGDCPPGCVYGVQTAPVGSSSWRSVNLGANQGGGDRVQLVRTGSLAAIEVYGNPAGGAPARAVLFTSRDDGTTWTRRGEPCRQQRPNPANPQGEVDSSLITSAPDGSITVLCTPRSQTGWQFTSTSTDGGVTFHPGDLRALGAAGVNVLAAASARIVLISSDETYRSSDSGHDFARLSANSGSSPGPVAWMGFASATVGHAISLDRRRLLTTTDAGRTWTASRWR